jgi:hypothetical protein
VRLPISAIDAISPAFHHTKQQLFQPFRIWQWARLALVGLLAGEMSSGGGCNFQVPQMRDGGQRFLPGSGPLASSNPALFFGLVALLVVLGVVLWLLILYASSVMRFVLFDSVLAKECHIRESWNRRQRPGLRYLGFHLLLLLGWLVVLTIVVGIPAGIAFAAGWLKNPSQHPVPLILGGIVLFFVLLALIVAFLAIMVLTKDFVVPQMAIEDIGVIEGWRRLGSRIRSEKGGFAAYLGMKILMALGAAMIIGIVSIFLVLLVAIPLGAVGAIALITGKTAGLTWNVYTITFAVVAGGFLVAIFIYAMALISVPAMVFFPAYSIHFFASRYQPLDAVLHPALYVPPPPELPPVSEVPPSSGTSPPDAAPPSEPPPLSPDFNPNPA